MNGAMMPQGSPPQMPLVPPGLTGTPPEDTSMPEATSDPIAQVEDSTLLQIMQSAYERSKTSRETRKNLNRRNWDAFHGKFPFLAKKEAGQSAIVIPSLETSLEQVCAQLSQQLVGFSHWFSAKFEGEIPALPGLGADEAARILSTELERLAVDSGCMPTTYGIGRLIYDSLKIGLIESEVTWKVTMQPDIKPQYSMGDGGQMIITETEEMRLRIDIVPFEDHFPDPGPAKHYNIHEMWVAVADLPDLGFTDDEIALMRQSSPGTEKLEERRRRGGVVSSEPSPIHQVLLREYWGDLIDPQDGHMIERDVKFITASNSAVVRKPVRITDEYWSGLRPFINVPLLPTPTADQHHAFLDIAVPLIEAECELFNMVVDAGFNAALGVKEIHAYKYEDPSEFAKGITAGMTLKRLEGSGPDPGFLRVETGTLTPDMIQIQDRLSRTRQEAFRTNDFQLGRQAQRNTSATEFNLINEASDDLFSNIALRFEDSAVEPLLELCWLTIWQFADQSMIQRIGALVGPESAQSIAALTPQERFVAFANTVGFKVQGYKYQLNKLKDMQKYMMLQQLTNQNPAIAQVVYQKFSPLKQYKSYLQALGIDPADLERDPNDPLDTPPDPNLLANQSGGQNPASNPMAGQQETMQPPNPGGERGPQMP